jgi:hypothetical protein
MWAIESVRSLGTSEPEAAALASTSGGQARKPCFCHPIRRAIEDQTRVQTTILASDTGSQVMPPGVASRLPQNDTATLGHTQWMLVLGILLALRITNALSIKTFFQPDEYFQSLEPAWQIAFGADSGAWITWVGRIFPLRKPSIS